MPTPFAPIYPAIPLSQRMEEDSEIAARWLNPHLVESAAQMRLAPTEGDNDQLVPRTNVEWKKGENRETRRLRGLTAFATQDIAPSYLNEAQEIFGQIRHDPTSAISYMNVGRALCANEGEHYEGNPSLYISERGRELGIALPEQWDSDTDLYTAIGQAFTTQARERAQQEQTQIAKARAARTREATALAEKGINAVINGETATPEQYNALIETGVDPSEIDLARTAIQQYQNAAKGNATPSILSLENLDSLISWDTVENYLLPTSPLTRLRQTAETLHRTLTGAPIRARDSGALLDTIADTLGEHHQARNIFLQYLQQTWQREQNKRNPASGSMVDIARSSIASAISAGTGASEKLVESARDFGKSLAQTVGLSPTTDSEEIQRQSLRAQASEARESGIAASQEAYKEQRGTLNYYLSTIPEKAVSFAAENAPWMTKYLTPLKLLELYQDNHARALSNIYASSLAQKEDPFDAMYNASWWETNGLPLARTGITGASMVLSGAAARTLTALSGRALARFGGENANAAVARLLGSKPGAWLGKSSESAASLGILLPLTEAGLNEAVDATLAPERQQSRAWESTVANFSEPEYWATQIVAGSLFGALGYRGVRDSWLYRKTLHDLNFTRKEIDEVVQQPDTQAAKDYIGEKLRAKLLEDPERQAAAMKKAGEAQLDREQIESAAASGVLEETLKTAGISDMKADGDGKISFKTIEPGTDGIPQETIHRWTRDQIISYLCAIGENKLTRHILETQSLLRAERGTRAIEKLTAEGKSPFQRVAYLPDFPPELLARLRGKEALDYSDLSAIGEYALGQIQQKMQSGMSEQEARQSEVSGIPLGSLTGLSADFANRAEGARMSGELRPGEQAEAASLILPGRQVGDQILLLIRGEASPADIAHEWAESFGRKRLETDPDTYRGLLNHLDSEITRLIPGSKGIFGGKNLADRNSQDYIEAWTRLAQADYLHNHRRYNFSDLSHDTMQAALEDLANMRTGFAFADEWNRFVESRPGKDYLTQHDNALQQLLEQAGLHMTDYYKAAAETSQKEALETITNYRQTKEREALQAAADLASETQLERTQEQERASAADAARQEPIPAEDNVTGEPLPAGAFAQPRPADPATGELSRPSLNAGAPEHAPKAAGKGLIGGIASRKPDGSVEGAALRSNITLHPLLQHSSPEQASIARLYEEDNAPILIYRHKSGKLEALSGLGQLEKASPEDALHVTVYDKDSVLTPSWATDQTIAYCIRHHLASPATTAEFVRQHQITREKAYERGLIPRDVNGQETPASRAAWQLAEHASDNALAELRSGKINLEQALKRAAANAASDIRASFNIRAKRHPRYSKLEDFMQEEKMQNLLDYAQKRERQLLQWTAEDTPSAMKEAGRIRGLVEGLYATIDKEARPWRHLKTDLEAIDAWTRAASDPFQYITKTNAIPETERFTYDSANARTRQTLARQALSRLTLNLTRSIARSLERHMVDKEIKECEKIWKTLQPKYQKNRKEKRGLTDAETKKRADRIHDMWYWDRETTETAQRTLMKAREAADLDQASIDRLNRDLQDTFLYAGLQDAPITQARAASEAYKELVRTGRDAWDRHLEEEKSIIRKWQKDLSDAYPEIKTSELGSKELKEERHPLVNLTHGLLNISQYLEAFGTFKGIGPIFTRIQDRLAVQLDQKVKYIDRARSDRENKLKEILSRGKKKPVSDYAMSRFLADAKEERNTGIQRLGRIKETTYSVTREEAEHLVHLTPEAREREAERIQEETRARGGEPKPYPDKRAVQEIEKRLNDPAYRGGRINITIQGERESTREETLKMSQMQALNIVLMGEQPSYRAMFANLGYTEDVLSALKKWVGPELMELGYWMRSYLEGTGLAEVYEARMGLPFPKEEKYWPGNFDISSNTNPSGDISTAISGTGLYQMLCKRTVHSFEPKTVLSADLVWNHAIEQHYTYITCGETTWQLRRFMHDKDTYARLQHIMGKDRLTTFKSLLDVIDGAPALQTAADKMTSKAISESLAARAVSALSGAVTTFTKQFTGILNAFGERDITVPGLLKEMARAAIPLVKTGHKTMSEIAQLDCFQIRKRERGLTDDMFDAAIGEKRSNWRYIEKAGMTFLEWADIRANLISMTGLYNYTFERLKKETLNDPLHKPGSPLSEREIQTIEKQCEIVVSKALHHTAQPLQRHDKSAVAATSSNAFAKSFYYMGSDVINKIAMANTIAQREIGKGASPLKAYAKAWAYLLPYSFLDTAFAMGWSYFAGNAPEPEDDDWWTWISTNSLFALFGGGFANRLPIIGLTMGELGNYAWGKSGPSTIASTGAGFTSRDIRALLSITDLEDNGAAKNTWNTYSSMRVLTNLINFIAPHRKGLETAQSVSSAINTLMNSTRPVIQRWKNEE